MTWPLPVLTEAYVGPAEGWRDVSSDVRLTSADSGGGITITRGRQNEGSQVQAGTAAYVWNNRHGKYSPRNPRSELYGLIGRNTPVRTGVRMATDPFARTTSNGWGTAPTGEVWSAAGTASSFAVAAGVATHTHTVVNVLLRTTLIQQLLDVEQVTDISVPAAVTGAALVTGHIGRWQATGGEHYWLRLEFNPGGTTTLKISLYSGGVHTVLAELVDVPGLTYTANVPIRLRTGISGQHLSVKAWTATAPEPNGWMLDVGDAGLRLPGRPGTQSWRVTGNSNSSPAISHRNYSQVNRRIHAEVTAWPPKWDMSEQDWWVPIDAAGIMRRLGQGTPPKYSALRRTVAGTAALAHYPMEDGAIAGQAASAIPGHPAMIVSGSVAFRPLEDYLFNDVVEVRYGTTALADIAGGGSLYAGLAPEVAANTQTLQTVSLWTTAQYPGLSGDLILAEWGTPGGTYARWQLVLAATGETRIRALTSSGASTTVIDYGVASFGFLILAVTLEQVGGNIAVTLRRSGFIDDTATVAGTMAGITSLAVNPTRVTSPTQTAIGYLTVYSSALVPYPFQVDALDAYGVSIAGPRGSWFNEVTTDRMKRLAAEAGIKLIMPDVDAADHTRMGWQAPGADLDLLAECAAVDGGILYELRDDLGFGYRPRSSLINQQAFEVSYADGHIADPFEPADDDEATRNDVTISRSDGSSYHTVQLTGPLSIYPPEDGGVGPYPHGVTLKLSSDDQLTNIGDLALYQGTRDEARYPAITFNLASSAWSGSSDMTAQATALDSGDVLQINALPDKLPPGPAKAMVQGTTETLDAYDWTVKFNASPGRSWDFAVAADSAVTADETEPRACVDVGVDAHTLTSGITSTALSFQVSFLVSRWEVDPAHFPILVDVGGEWIRVSAITGLTSPQTFTVPVGGRAVNGVVMAHLAGVPVDVAYPAIAGP